VEDVKSTESSRQNNMNWNTFRSSRESKQETLTAQLVKKSMMRENEMRLVSQIRECKMWALIGPSSNKRVIR
jgi:hypothetical protein